MLTTLLARPRAQVVYRGGSASDPPGWLSGLFGPRTTSGEVVTQDTALTISTYFACLRNLSEDVGKLPCKLFEKMDPRGKRPLDADPLYAILHDQVNPTLSAQVCWEMLTQWTAGWGNGYAEIERTRRGDPLALWPVHPSRVPPRKRAEDPYVVISDNGRRDTIDRDNMLHIRGMGDEVQGYSVCELAAESLGLSLAAQTFGAAYFGNDAALGIVIKVPADTTLTEEQIRDLRGSWIKPHVGANNAYKPKVLSDGITAERISIPPKDSQFLETRTFQVVDICRWFRMPPHKVQHLDKATFSNIEQQSIEYVTDTLMPWLTRIETECKLKLIPVSQRQRRYVRFVVLGLLRGDSAARSTFHKEMFLIGAESPNDIRELEDMNPRDGGDEYFVPANMIGNQGTRPDSGGSASGAGQVLPADPPEQREEKPVSREAAKAAMMPVFVDAVARLVRREANALSRAKTKYAADHDACDEWAQGFYSEHMTVCIESLEPACLSLARLVSADPGGVQAALSGYVGMWIRGRLRDLFGPDPDPDNTAATRAVDLTNLVDC